MGAGGDILQETGISGMAEQFAGGGLVTIFSAIFFCIWVISDYTHGVMENLVGKSYSRVQVFLAKVPIWSANYRTYEFSYLPFVLQKPSHRSICFL